MSQIGSALAAFQAALSGLKFLLDTKGAFIKAEYEAKLAEVYATLTEAYKKVAEMNALLLKKDEEIRTLKQQQQSVGGVMTFIKPFYYLVDGDQKDGPFCPACLDDQQKRIRLKDYRNGAWSCPKCNNHYTDASWHADDDGPRRIRNAYDPFEG